MRRCGMTAVLLLALGNAISSGATLTRREKWNDMPAMVLENEHARVVVIPEIGGAVAEFKSKKTGENFVAGQVGRDKEGKPKLGPGWIDYNRIPQPDGPAKWFGREPYQAEFTSGRGYKGIRVWCTIQPIRIDREMRLMDDRPELIVPVKHTNVGKRPYRMWVRWHPWCMLADTYAENSCIISPGEPGIIRKIMNGWGWDNNLFTHDGYWLAANYKTGEGIWTTFEKEGAPVHFTWTSYKRGRYPTRGAVTLEPFPHPILGKPGETVSLACSYCLFTAEDSPDSLPMGVLKDANEIARAREFLRIVKPNLAAIGPFTEIPPENKSWLAFEANRFSHNHRRRDRVAVRAWGFVDAMLRAHSLHRLPDAVSKQAGTYYGNNGERWLNKLGLRARYYAQMFDRADAPRTIAFRVTATDSAGRIQLEKKSQYVLHPKGQRVLDIRDQIALNSLPDGKYVFAVEVYVSGEKEPAIRYEALPQSLIGNRHAEFLKRGRPRYKERPFVAALARIDPGKVENGHVTVPIGVEEGGGIARRAWPISVGVPFPKGAVKKDSAIVLTDPKGRTIQAQTQAMAAWDDGSLRWLLVDFLADVPADQYVFYQLTAWAEEPEVARKSPPRLISDKGDHFVVDNGPTRIEVPKKAAPRLFGYFAPGDLWWIDGSGVKYSFALKGEGAGMAIEKNGPIHAVLKANGWYFNEQGRALCMGELRWEFWRGQSFTRLHHTVTYCGQPYHDQLGSYGITFSLPGGPYRRVAVDGDRRTCAQGKTIALHQKASDYFDVTVDGKQGNPGRRCTGAVQFSGRGNTTVFHRDLWRMNPKKIAADAAAGTVAFSYWPKEAGVMSFLPREEGWIPSSSSIQACGAGASRTHEFIIETNARRPVQAYERTFNEPVIALTPPRWLRRTWTMLHLSPYDFAAHPKLEEFFHDLIAAYQRHRDTYDWYGEWVYGGIPNSFRADWYRWIGFGRYAWILNEQNIVNAPWLLYFRSGDRLFYKFAESNTRHLMEVGTIRWNAIWPRQVGMSRRHHECIWLSAGDFGHSMLDPFVNYYHATGYRPAWDAALLMGRAMARIHEGAWRYVSNPLVGCTRLYLETADPFWKKHADRIWTEVCSLERNRWWSGDHGDRAVVWYSQLNPEMREIALKWSNRPKFFEGADVRSMFYAWTKDQRFLKDVAKRIRPLTRRPEPDPFRYPITTITQYELTWTRAACYAGETLKLAQEN